MVKKEYEKSRIAIDPVIIPAQYFSIKSNILRIIESHPSIYARYVFFCLTKIISWISVNSE